MKTVATIKLKIPKNNLLLDMMKQYSKAVSYIADEGYKAKIHRRYDLHHLCYYKTREKFNLPSQFVINANRVASQTLKSVKTNKGSKPIFKEYMPLAFDRRTFTFSKNKVRLTTLNGRIEIPIKTPEYYHKYLDWRYQTALLILDRKQRLFFHITFSREIKSSTKTENIVGVDLGVNNLAVTSDRKIFRTPKANIKRFHYLRRKLQAKGTKSATRKLKAISGRQKRFMAWVNHNVSKQIVKSGDIIVLEKLKGIRKSRNKHMGKRLNRWLNNWSFYQLQSFIRYKAEREGKTIAFVSPFMTSQICSRCCHKGSRFGNSFVCLHCSYESDADFNASCNLRRLYVTQPNVSGNDAKANLGTAAELRDKSSQL